jgi:MFS family permease
MQMSGDFAAMIAPVLLGAISDAYGYRPAFLISAVITGAIFIVATRIPETRNTVHRTEQPITDL